MPKPNYAFEKRQRELEKKQKRENKAQRKSASADAPRTDGIADDAGHAPDAGEAAAPADGSPAS